MDIGEEAEKVKTYKEFLLFLELLKEDFIKNKKEWDNDTLESFLEGLFGYVYDKQNIEPSWNSFASILVAATVYE